MTDSLLSIALAFTIVAVSPGPANIATATVAMGHGRRAGMTFGLGLGIGMALWGVVAATGLGALLQGSVPMLIALKLCGGAYLLWLALGAARTAANGAPASAAQMAKGRWFWRGALLNLSNPKAVIAWMAALSMGMDAGGDPRHLILATALCFAIGFANYAAYALAFSLPGCMAGYRRLHRWVEGVVAGLFALAGLGLIRSALSR